MLHSIQIYISHAILWTWLNFDQPEVKNQAVYNQGSHYNKH